MHAALPCRTNCCRIPLTVCARSQQNSVTSRADQREASSSSASKTLLRPVGLRQNQLLQLYGILALTSLTTGDSSAAFAAETASASQSYVPSPVNIGWEVYAGAIAGVIPFAIGSYQFIARILIQRRCSRCNGSGLIERGPFLRKCPECGGFFPWQGWKRFFTSTAAPGNGGVLRQPRNQDGVIYRIPPKAKDEASK